MNEKGLKAVLKKAIVTPEFAKAVDGMESKELVGTFLNLKEMGMISPYTPEKEDENP